MQDYVKTFQEKIAAIDADAQRINIINAGVMNHGKSSLFNSLLDKNIFPEEDIRKTVALQTELWRDNVYLIDTPGLSAETVDDAVAYEAYRRANVILFVHRVDTGELHRAGLEGLNKIKSLFADQKFFTDHLCLVLTSIDEQSARENLDAIRDKALADIKNFCGLSGFKVFCVSNTRYKQGKEENEEFFVAESGIPELRDYLQQNFSKWSEENKAVRAERITREKEDFIAKLNQERGNVQSRIQSKTEQIKQRQKSFLYKVEAAVNQRRAEQSEAETFAEAKRSDLRNLEKDIEKLDERLDRLREVWDNAREKYYR